MDGREISLWFEARKLDALQKAMGKYDMTVEVFLQRYLQTGYQMFVPIEERKQIESTIAEEEQVAQAEHEAARRFSVARVTEGSATRIFLLERGEDLCSTAQRLRRYLRPNNPGMWLYPDGSPLSEPEMERHVAETIRGSQRVVGVYDINLDAGEISILNDTIGWRTYKAKDVSTAVYFATKKQSDSWVTKRNRFYERMKDVQPLDVRHPLFIRGDQPLPVDDLAFEEEVCEIGDLLNFHIPVNFDVDSVFGTHVNTSENGDWLNVYANYDMERGCIRNSLDVCLVRGDGSEIHCRYRLTSKECATLLSKMDDYCKQTMGKGLEECRAEYLAQEQGAGSQEPLSGPTLQM